MMTVAMLTLADTEAVAFCSLKTSSVTVANSVLDSSSTCAQVTAGAASRWFLPPVCLAEQRAPDAHAHSRARQRNLPAERRVRLERFALLELRAGAIAPAASKREPN